jgi:hypothetical protein
MNDTSSVVSNASLQWTWTGSCCDEALDPGNIPPHDRVLCPSNVKIVSIIETSRSTVRLSPESQVELVPPAQTADPVVSPPSYISQSTSDIGKRSLNQSFSTTDVRHGSWSMMNELRSDSRTDRRCRYGWLTSMYVFEALFGRI